MFTTMLLVAGSMMAAPPPADAQAKAKAALALSESETTPNQQPGHHAPEAIAPPKAGQADQRDRAPAPERYDERQRRPSDEQGRSDRDRPAQPNYPPQTGDKAVTTR